MKIAIKREATVISEDGRVAGHDSGATLVRRFLRLFPEAQVIGPVPRRCDGFDVVPIAFVDPEDTVIINMDVLDSTDIWNTIYRESGGAHANIMNFVWWPTSDLESTVERPTMALSCALFPTFANSERTASEIRELTRKLTVSSLAEQAKLAWVNLGFRLDHVKDRQETDVPVVLYPAIYLSDRKRPDLFRKVVEKVRDKVPLKVEMRLQESHLVSEKAMQFSRLNWVWVGPLTAERNSYWEALAHTTAFLATAAEESYGLSYVEAMGAGAIGVFPNLEWARILVPEGYPFLYDTEDEATTLLTRAVEDPDACRKELDELVGGSFTGWINEHHSDDVFDREVVAAVNNWFA
ncbi:glycosyltransferase family 4 protein [Actinomycetaceae bacterium WB03_NA08]|uniref:Glycosyltransferase family 4 protein n=1 Tax=Scrofimicrobium canadense TaxID=2652290 RepID=A0A6N7VPR5_9ACTO|nr:glycosyltransferase family 1 protein [Scrofimicrobium canadense]MSS83739.1 glycosyltransferase family 4 protein [Scrofimicrobium canadense]